jgi:hypothetical protein
MQPGFKVRELHKNIYCGLGNGAWALPKGSGEQISHAIISCQPIGRKDSIQAVFPKTKYEYVLFAKKF